ncbi:MAG: cyclic nucleotide-binding domain-containing protein, partial [Candidatus Margulisiibacteriota bacterium]
MHIISIINTLRSIPVFSGFNQLELEQFAKAFKVKGVTQNTVITKEGSIEPSLNIVLNGHFQESALNHRNEKKVLSILTNGDCFGEMSLLTSKPQSSTVQSCANGTIA